MICLYVGGVIVRILVRLEKHSDEYPEILVQHQMVPSQIKEQYHKEQDAECDDRADYCRISDVVQPSAEADGQETQSQTAHEHHGEEVHELAQNSGQIFRCGQFGLIDTQVQIVLQLCEQITQWITVDILHNAYAWGSVSGDWMLSEACFFMCSAYFSFRFRYSLSTVSLIFCRVCAPVSVEKSRAMAAPVTAPPINANSTFAFIVVFC